MKPADFIRKYKPFALETQQKTGISALFILAQAALESGWGKHAPGNMFFGVKASKNTPENKRQLLVTTEYLKTANARFPEILSVTRLDSGIYKYRVKDWFRKYDTPEECFTDHAALFTRNIRYAKALEVKHNPFAFATAIAVAGYATAPGYAQSLHAVCRTVEQYF